jgi:patatin-related protein
MSYDPSQEVRFAVVMYGGVSLAIYMNGVAQELLRAVRATADLPAGTKLDESERVYREIGQRLFWGREQGEDSPPSADADIQTRIVVDIISGTSAGGINGVFLAKALALGSKDLKDLEQMWLEDADIGTLLNDAAGSERTSLLNSPRMYDLLLDALNRMGDAGGPPLADQIDLFVTTTDLNGLPAPIELTDKWADEKMYKMMFHFQSGDTPGDFARGFNPMLAFAARCTSSFPVAFEPMLFKSIDPTDPEEQTYSKFFERYARREAKYDDRPFADGGILDNKPFSYAIDAIRFRNTTRPVDRKLLFVDPSPERDPAPDSTTTPLRQFDFVENAMASLVTLPGYETIRGEIERVNERNRYLGRLQSMRDRLPDAVWKEMPSVSVPNFGSLDLTAMLKLYGPAYAACHNIKVFGVTDSVARIVTNVMGFNPESDEYRAIRQVMRAWREDHYAPNPGGTGLETENKLLLDFDMEYRLRRLRHIREAIDEGLKQRGEERKAVREALKRCREKIQEQLTTLFKYSQELESRELSPLKTILSEDHDRIEGTELLDIVSPPPEADQYRRAKTLYGRVKPMLEAATGHLSDLLAAKFKDASKAALAALNASASDYAESGLDAQKAITALRDQYNTYDRYDCLVLPLLSGTGIEETGQVGIFRVSPVDVALCPHDDQQRPETKLAGVKLGHFGAFLSQDWRQNDIMWGRLDGAARIISALLPDAGDERLRDRLIQEAQAEILKEELGKEELFSWLAQYVKEKVGPAASERDLAAKVKSMFAGSGTDAAVVILRELIGSGTGAQYEEFVKTFYEVPTGPEPQEVLNWAGRAATIVGDMFNGLKEAGTVVTTVASKLKVLGVLVTQSVRFAIPNGPMAVLGRYWMFLLALASVILIVVGPFASKDAGGIGWIALGISAALFLAQQVLRNYLVGRPWWKGALTILGAAVVVLFLGVFGVGVIDVARWMAGNKWLLDFPHQVIGLFK